MHLDYLGAFVKGVALQGNPDFCPVRHVTSPYNAFSSVGTNFHLFMTTDVRCHPEHYWLAALSVSGSSTATNLELTCYAPASRLPPPAASLQSPASCLNFCDILIECWQSSSDHGRRKGVSTAAEGYDVVGAGYPYGKYHITGLLGQGGMGRVY